MKILHEAEEPSTRILARLLQAFPGSTASLLSDSISLDSSDAEFAFRRREPSSLRRVIREKEEAKKGD